MPRLNPEARQRLVAAAADMLRRRGLNATSVREVAKHAQAPLGSTYHYFPGGKQQMVAEAVESTAGFIARLLSKELKAGVATGLRSILGFWRQTLIDTDFHAGCPVLAVSVEEPESDQSLALAAAGAAFASWEAMLTGALEAEFQDRDKAHRLATLIIASFEGAIAMCRAKRTIEPFDQVTEQLEKLVTPASVSKVNQSD